LGNKDLKQKIHQFNTELLTLIDRTKLPYEVIVDGLILQGVTFALECAHEEMEGMKLVHICIEDAINFYQKYYS
jgi:hypothetical protein